MILLSLLFLIAAARVNSETEEELCKNKFVYLSTNVLVHQSDLKKTFDEINGTARVEEVSYQEDLFKSYRIFNIKQNITYNQARQDAKLVANNVLRVTGGTVRTTYAFEWMKTQLGTSFYGTGTGTVTSNNLTYEKTMITNVSHELQWHLTYSQPVNITNGLSLSTMDPYRAADYEILSNMLNKLKNNQTTVKENLLKAINTPLQSVLARKVLEDKIMDFEKSIYYNYSDYRGLFQLNFSNVLVDSLLTDKGLYLLFSQKLIGVQQFKCGEPVPFVPNDPSVYGGMQQFYSNDLIKATLKHAINNGSLDVIFKDEIWQSRAFQFFIGDLYEVMPSSMKNLPIMEKIIGKCVAIDDPVFSFTVKNTKSYEAKVNFACHLSFGSNQTKFIDINLVANYEISPKITSKTLDFQLTGLTGAPAFIQSDPFKIQYQQLAEFMVSETLSLAKSGYVYGTGYRLKYPRKHPMLLVSKSYLFLYDASAISKRTA